MVISESPIPSPISRMTLRAPEAFMVRWIVLVWSPLSRAAPPLADSSPLAARLSGSPLDILSSPLHATRASAAALTTQIDLNREFIDMSAPSCELAERIRRDRRERQLAGRE